MQVTSDNEPYSTMTDDELLFSASHANNLGDEAMQALRAEIGNRDDIRSEGQRLVLNSIQGPKRFDYVEKAGLGAWPRLGIFLAASLGFAIAVGVIRGQGNPALIKSLTRFALSVGLAGWGFSSAINGQWLTIRRTWIIAVIFQLAAYMLLLFAL